MVGRMIRRTVTLDPASVAANTKAPQSFVIRGMWLKPRDTVHVHRKIQTAGVDIVAADVTSVDTLRIYFRNLTGAPVVPDAGEFVVTKL